MKGRTRYTTIEQRETKLNMDKKNNKKKPASQQTIAAATKQGTDIYRFSTSNNREAIAQNQHDYIEPTFLGSLQKSDNTE